MSNILNQPEVLAALIEGSLGVIATVIPSIVGLILSRRFFQKKQVERTCLNALYELRFMQAVESEAINLTGTSKIALRKATRENASLESSGLFTPSILAKKIASLEKRIDTDSPYNV